MKQQEERIAMRSIKRLSNGISREMCAAFGSGMFSGAQGRTLHFLLAHTKSDIFQKDIEEEFGLRPPTATALLKELDQKLTAGISDEEMQVFFYVTGKMLDNLAK